MFEPFDLQREERGHFPAPLGLRAPGLQGSDARGQLAAPPLVVAHRRPTVSAGLRLRHSHRQPILGPLSRLDLVDVHPPRLP